MRIQLNRLGKIHPAQPNVVGTDGVSLPQCVNGKRPPHIAAGGQVGGQHIIAVHQGKAIAHHRPTHRHILQHNVVGTMQIYARALGILDNDLANRDMGSSVNAQAIARYPRRPTQGHPRQGDIIGRDSNRGLVQSRRIHHHPAGTTAHHRYGFVDVQRFGIGSRRHRQQIIRRGIHNGILDAAINHCVRVGLSTTRHAIGRALVHHHHGRLHLGRGRPTPPHPNQCHN